MSNETLKALTVPGTNGLDLIKRLGGLVVLSRASGRRGFISLMHHMEEIGSPNPILGELYKTVVLLGFKDNAVPATVDETSLLETSTEKVPSIDFLATLKDEDDVFKELESTTPTTEMRICNSIMLPPWLTKVLIKNKAGTMGNAFIIALRAANSLDVIEGQEDGNMASGIGRNVKEITSLLQHLYFWAQKAELWSATGEVITNAANAAFDEDVLEWSDNLHARFISKQLDSGRNEICNDKIRMKEGEFEF
mmetsp:Transcript_5189/g.7576  ORF Transcript_5189/g.7576 Transcript_5189/m.7576 type:complete len:251 (+) Transcript_5189:55-807(+)